MIDEQYKYSRVTAEVIRAAMTVRAALGNGFQEVMYQRAPEIEMALIGLSFSREFEMPKYFTGRTRSVQEGGFFGGRPHLRRIESDHPFRKCPFCTGNKLSGSL